MKDNMNMIFSKHINASSIIDVSLLKKGLFFTSVYIDGKLISTHKFVKE